MLRGEVAVALLLCFSCASGIFNRQFIKKTLRPDENADPGEPLFVTPYIERGDIETARNLSLVQLEGTSMKTYSGFFTVNKAHNSNMFFWFCPSQNGDPRDPVLLWLQGGPGGSSLFGLFVENGPFGVDQDLKLFEREFSWNKNYNVLFFDNPVGTGFSFANDEGYARNEDDVSENLYNALLQFFELFPILKGNDVYLTGESYAGKYVPALAYKIHVQPPPKKVVLKGVAIGDGFTDPPVMIQAYADFMFQTGQLDENQRDFFKEQCELCGKMIEKKKWVEAFETFDLLLDGDLVNVTSYYTNCTGTTNYYNYLRTKTPDDYEYYSSYINKADVRKRIHVGKLPYNSGEKVENYLMEDIMQSAKHFLIPIMNQYKVLLYSGNLDVIVALPLTEAMLQTTDWNGAADYKKAKRDIWKIHPKDVEVAGYIKRVHNFYQASIRGAGHIAPYDQPERSWEMIHRFIENKL